jgi:hypothetical protein
LFASGVFYTSGKFACSVVDTNGNLPQASLAPVANLPLISTTLAKLVKKIAACVVDTCGKFALCQ